MAAKGRPRINDDRAKAHHVAVRLTPAEHVAVIERATAAGVSVSDFIRTSLAIGPRAARRSASAAGVLSGDDRAALNAIAAEERAIGRNLNQVARILNAGIGEPIAADLANALAGYGAMRAKLDAVLDRYLPA